jgi:putative ABC transport system permease protein
MRFFITLQQSLDAIRANAFRAGVTIVIIALGITALVVVRTSIEGIKAGMSSSFSQLGANTFRVQNRASNVQFGRRGRDAMQDFPPITLREAQAFQERMANVAPVSISGSGSTVKVAYRQESTNPNIRIIASDQFYLTTSRQTLAAGRSLTEEDVALARNVVVLGHDVKADLFPYASAVGKKVNVGGNIATVVGVFEQMGTTGLSSSDRSVLMPITTLRAKQQDLGSLTLNVFVAEPAQMDYLMAEAQGIFRVVRGLSVREPDNFSLSKSDAFVNQLVDQLGVITISAQVIALITLLGASIALLNVMLVSVTERTREIGVRKAMGASGRSIMQQFLWEAIMICQVGAVLGILLGVVGGNLISNLLFDGVFVAPWDWILIGLIACFLVGVFSGYAPARKAARVDPIVALRNV